MGDCGSCVDWQLITDAGPKTAHAAGCFLLGNIYIHGGITEKRSTKPNGDLHRFDVESARWSTISANGSPALSHHCCIPWQEKYILFIGGWNGKERTSTVYIYSCKENQWMKVEPTGFPMGAGLSSHTACLLDSGEIIIVGREGGLRTQRRSGNCFILSGNAERGHFQYRDHGISVASRSGHTCSGIGKEMITLGGRDDKLTELHKLSTIFLPQIYKNCDFVQSLQTIFDSRPPATKAVPCRKNHSACLVDRYILVFGGETFDGRSKGPVRDLYIIDSKNSYTWKYVGQCSIGRSGHQMHVTDHQIILHGGINEANRVTSSTYELTINGMVGTTC